MNRNITPPIPEAIVQLQRQLDQFRSTQPRRTKLPEPLWQAAVELARQHGIYPVAHPLRLDYMGLKKRLPMVRALQTSPALPALSDDTLSPGGTLGKGRRNGEWRVCWPPWGRR